MYSCAMAYHTRETLGKYLNAKQGKMSESAYDKSVNVTRTAIRAMKAGEYNPSVKVLARLGLSIVYKTLDTPAATQPAPKVSAKKVAAKKKAA